MENTIQTNQVIVKRTRPPKIDVKTYKELRGQGLSQPDAYSAAGGEGKSRFVLASNASIFEKKHELKDDIIKKLKDKRGVALRALSPQKARKESFRNLAISIGILTEKIQLLEGKPTQHSASVVKLYLPEQRPEQRV